MLRTLSRYDLLREQGSSYPTDPGELVIDGATHTGRGMIVSRVGDEVAVLWSIVPNKPLQPDVSDLERRIAKGDVDGWTPEEAERARQRGLITGYTSTLAHEDGTIEVRVDLPAGRNRSFSDRDSRDGLFRTDEW